MSDYTHGYDTETTGLIDFKQDLMHPDQPRLVQLASVVAAADGTVVDEFCVIIQPDGWVIPDEAAAIHGITQERAIAEGIPVLEALMRFDAHKKLCGARVAHNLSYDKKIIAREYHLAEMAHDSEGITSHCTMVSGTSVCKIPSPNGRGGYKWPKLTELHQHLFGTGFEGAHDALNDLRATMRCFFEMRRLGVV